jgi:hypothetical protein
MKKTINELAEMAKVYFDSPKKIDKILATEDGNFFYNTEEGRISARNHARTYKLKVVEITRDDIDSKTKLAEKAPIEPEDLLTAVEKDVIRTPEKSKKDTGKKVDIE